MARFGSFVWGDGTLFGTDGLTVPEAEFFDVFAGESPALPSRTVPIRTGCAEIRVFDPATWTVGAVLPYVAAGATRQASLTGVGFQQETLSFTVANPADYYRSGPGASYVAPGAWLAVQWTVATATADTVVLGGVFRVETTASPTQIGVGATTLQVQAVDWAQLTLSQRFGGGWLSWLTLNAARAAYVASGLPQFLVASAAVPDPDSAWGNVLGGWLLLHVGATDPLHVEPWITDKFFIPFQAEWLQIGDPGKPQSSYDLFTWAWFFVGGFTLSYALDGRLLLHPGGPTATDSGCYLSTDTTVCGATPLPWAAPLVRQISRPSFTAAEYYQHILPDPAGHSITGGPLEDPGAVRLVHAESTSLVNPYDPTRDTIDVTVETIQEPLGVLVTQLTLMDGAWGVWKLSTALGPADTITLAVDSAFPPPPLGKLVRVHAPPDVDDWYRVTGFTQPLGAALASWQLAWWGTA